MWSAQAPIYQVDGDTFSSDFADSHTTRMIDLMDHMFANGTLVIDGLFTADFPAKHKDKVLGIPGPTWFDGAIIKNPDILNAPEGTWGAANALHWDGEPTATGNVGGGFWYGSSHSKNLACVANVPGVRHQRTPVRQAHHRPPGPRGHRECVVGRAGCQRLLGKR